MNALEKIVAADALHADEVPFNISQAEARITELATMKPLDYELCREAEAKALKMRVSVLDRLVEERRPKDEDGGRTDPFETVEPWHDPVDAAALLASAGND